ncbi:MAG: S8 family serine peptidase [Flavobacteriaceae bacterium]
MRKITLGMVSLALLALGCDIEDTANESLKNGVQEINLTGSYGDAATLNREVVVYYKDGTTAQEKEAIRMAYGIEDIKTCTCADEHLELWKFGEDVPQGEIEEIIGTAQTEHDLEGTSFNKVFKLDENDIDAFSQINDPHLGLNLRVTENTGVTIAVLDTGIMYDYEGFTAPLLYNSTIGSGSGGGQQPLFGWNFVEGNNNPYDDYHGKHGTVVSHILSSRLQQNNIPFQILPIKVADSHGRVSYFDVLCGFRYAVQNGDVDIINMSFGWNGFGNDLLQQFIEESQEEVLIVCSAGNAGSNNDDIPHYPSSYTFGNIIATASLCDIRQLRDQSKGLLASFSNYGALSVDLAAPGENLPFSIQGTTHTMNGTSYAAAFMSYMAARYHTEGISPIDLKNLIVSQSQYHPMLEDVLFSSFVYE